MTNRFAYSLLGFVLISIPVGAIVLFPMVQVWVGLLILSAQIAICLLLVFIMERNRSNAIKDTLEADRKKIVSELMSVIRDCAHESVDHVLMNGKEAADRIEEHIGKSNELAQEHKKDILSEIHDLFSAFDQSVKCSKEKSVSELTERINQARHDIIENAEQAKDGVTRLIEDTSRESSQQSKGLVDKVISSTEKRIASGEEAIKAAMMDSATDNKNAIISAVEATVRSIENNIGRHKEDIVSRMADSATSHTNDVKGALKDGEDRLSEAMSRVKDCILEGVVSDRNVILDSVKEAIDANRSGTHEDVDSAVRTLKDEIGRTGDMVSSIFEIVMRMDREYVPAIVDGLRPQFDNSQEYVTIANASLVKQIRLLQATIFGVISKESHPEGVLHETGGVKVSRYVNSQTGETVENREKDGVLLSSRLLMGASLMYEMEYDKDGRISRSKNYDNNGKVTSEMTFHSNGQIASRIQHIIKDGKDSTVTAKFDIKGNKI